MTILDIDLNPKLNLNTTIAILFSQDIARSITFDVTPESDDRQGKVFSVKRIADYWDGFTCENNVEFEITFQGQLLLKGKSTRLVANIPITALMSNLVITFKSFPERLSFIYTRSKEHKSDYKGMISFGGEDFIIKQGSISNIYHK